MNRSILRGQRGGVALLTALSFVLFSIPLITASLDLAQVSSIDARVKTNIVQRQYCGLAVEEYLSYLTSDNTRWTTWLANNVDPNDPSGDTSTETVNPCGKNITVTVIQQPVVPSGSTFDPIGNPLITIPLLSDFDDREFQVFKTVSDPNPTGGQPVTFTITMINRSDTATTLDKIRDTLPAGFDYDCNASADQLTLPGIAPQNILPDDPSGLCPNQPGYKDEVQWDLSPGYSIPPGGVVTLTFNAVTSVVPATYCNEVEVEPGQDKTSSGKTAIVRIGTGSDPCPDSGLVVTLTVNSTSLVSTDTSTNPYTYTFNIDFAIKAENIGTADLSIHEYKDLLPEGFSYLSTSPSGDITNIPDEVKQASGVNRQWVTWQFSPDIPITAGTSKTLIFTTIATINQGNYWSDLLADINGGLLSQDRYSWPTALVSVKDVYDVTATDDEGNAQVIALQVWIGDLNGVINTWNLP